MYILFKIFCSAHVYVYVSLMIVLSHFRNTKKKREFNLANLNK